MQATLSIVWENKLFGFTLRTIGRRLRDMNVIRTLLFAFTTTSLGFIASAAKPVKVFILAG